MSDQNWRSTMYDEEPPSIIKLLNVAGWICISAISIPVYLYIFNDTYSITMFVSTSIGCFFTGLTLLILDNIARNIHEMKNLLRRQLEAMKDLIGDKK